MFLCLLKYRNIAALSIDALNVYPFCQNYTFFIFDQGISNHVLENIETQIKNPMMYYAVFESLYDILNYRKPFLTVLYLLALIKDFQPTIPLVVDCINLQLWRICRSIQNL